MVDTACNYLNLYAPATLTARPAIQTTLGQTDSSKMDVQYAPETSSTGSVSPLSSLQSAPSSASVSPNIFPSPAQSFASISSSPPASASASATSSLSGSSSVAAAAAAAAVTGHTGHTTASATDLGAAAAAYSWNTAYTAALPTRTQFPYAQYTPDYYGTNGISMSASAAAAGAWFSHQERLYPSWSAQTYPTFNFEDIAFQTQLQRRSVRCTCPNCANEMSGLPPIVGPDDRGRKQHICHIPGCERLYGKASHLKTHLRWHTGERPFMCLTCGKRFSRSDELQRHGRTHTNYRPYACAICSKKFSRSDHLSKHKKTHFKDKKSKKALAKEQAAAAAIAAANIKQEEALEAVEKNIAAINIAANGTSTEMPLGTPDIAKRNNASSTMPTAIEMPQANATAEMASKGEQSDMLPARLSPYTNWYTQSSSVFHHAHPLASSTSYSAMQQSAMPGTTATMTQQPSAAPTYDFWNNQRNTLPEQPIQQQQVSRSAMESQQQQYQTVQNGASNNSLVATSVRSNSTAVPSLHHEVQQMEQQTSALSSATSSQQYAALAMQSESQLAANYSLNMSSAAGAGVGHSTPVNHHMQHHLATAAANASSYSGLIGQMKTEYASYADFQATSGYATATGAFHHHHHHHAHHAHNPWVTAASYQHPHVPS